MGQPKKTAALDPDLVAEDAIGKFVDDSYNCAEAVVAAFSEARGEPPDTLTPLVSPFGGGVASLGHMCGAISGALVVLGRRAGELGLGKREIRSMAQDLHGSFERRFGTTACRELTRHDCESGTPFDLRNCGKYIAHVVAKTCASLEAHEERARGAPAPPASS
jgi:C_GCAxxG_C_C family probable redox protein